MSDNRFEKQGNTKFTLTIKLNHNIKKKNKIQSKQQNNCTWNRKANGIALVYLKQQTFMLDILHRFSLLLCFCSLKQNIKLQYMYEYI